MAQAEEAVSAIPDKPVCESALSSVRSGALEWRLQITSDPANLARVRQELEEFCLPLGFDDIARGEIILCVNEALTNITRHAYGGATDRPIELEARFTNGTLYIQTRDWGCGKAPVAAPEHDPLKPGGVGMVCLRKLMDHVSFLPQPDGMILRMDRSLRSVSPGPDPQGAVMDNLISDSDVITSARRAGDALVVALRGELDLHNSPELRAQLLDLLARTRPSRLVVDMGQVPYMDSSALAVLVEVLKKLMKTKGRVHLFALQPRVKGLLEIARLSSIFVICDNEQEAMK
jgi:anti-sigma B factor antagonist